jgi:hypothetical protein
MITDAVAFSTVTGPSGIGDLALSLGGSTLTLGVRNLSNTASSKARVLIEVAGTTADDALLTWSISGGQAYSAGIDNSISGDPWCLSASTALETTPILYAIPGGEVGIGGVPTTTVYLDITLSKTGANVITRTQNSSNTASSNARHQVQVGGTSAGDPFMLYTLSGGADWAIGLDNSVTTPEADPFVIARSTALGTSDVARWYSDRVQLVLGAATKGEGCWIRRAHVQTTDATVTTVSTVAIGTSKIHALRVSLAAIRSTAAEAAYYERFAAYKNNAGTVTLIGAAASPITAEDAAAWDITLTISGTDVLVRVTGAVGSTIEWECIVEEVITSV